jgi:hypothetical protein
LFYSQHFGDRWLWPAPMRCSDWRPIDCRRQGRRHSKAIGVEK